MVEAPVGAIRDNGLSATTLVTKTVLVHRAKGLLSW